MKIPNFFVVGAPKAGTTSLYFYLREHPDVYLPSVKELHFFSYPEVTDTYYKVNFVTNLKSYLGFYKDVKNEKVIGDISPSYLFYSIAAERIKLFNPEAKIIIILRNPVDRAISHYLMDLRKGYQKYELKKFLQKSKTNILYYKEYITVGFYYKNIKKYLNTFGKKQVLILLYDELVSNPKNFILKIYDFLDINRHYWPDLQKKYNTFEMPRTFLIYYARRLKILNELWNISPQPIKNYIKKFSLLKKTTKPDYTEEKKVLVNIYQEDIYKLSTLLNKDLSHWLI